MPDRTGSPGYRLRPTFVEQLDAIAASLGLDIEWLSDFWVCELGDAHGHRTRITGGYFGINDAGAAQLANDKAAAFEVLHARGVAAVPHHLLRAQGRSVTECAAQVLADHQLPVVLKPNLEAGGVDVLRADIPASLTDALTTLLRRYRAVAVSPYRAIVSETRIVVLDGVVRFAFEKVVDDASGWQHNLRLGARPELVDLADLLRDLALRACGALGLRFATVDVVTTEANIEVLEVNSSVTLDRFSRVSDTHWQLAREVYEDVVRRLLPG